jgi:hypothetical protein
MRQCGSFSDILEQKIGDFEPEPPAACAHEWRPMPGPTVLYFDSRFYGAQGLPRHIPAGATHRPSVRPLVRPARVVRPQRTLTPIQRQALESFASHGAALATDYTDSELRSAFRTLARRYHPDRHPESGAEQQARLSRTFSGLSDAYRHLIAASVEAVAIAA